MRTNVFTGEIRKTSEVFSELSNSMKLYESGELTYVDLSKHLMVILGDISLDYDDLQFWHRSVLLKLVEPSVSRDPIKGAISRYITSGQPGGKISLIKELRSAFDMDLREAKEVVEDICVFDSGGLFINFKED